MSGKGISLIPFVFLILFASIGLTSWAIYNTYYGDDYQEIVSDQSYLDAARNEHNKIKNYARQSLIYSSFRTLRASGGMGGIMAGEPRAWICNEPTVPSIPEVVECLEDFTNYHLDIYMTFYDEPDIPMSLSKENFSSVEYDIIPPDVYDKKHDYGNFTVESKEGYIGLYSDRMQTYENINQEEFINKTRYWYMFRIFEEWATDNVYANCIQYCTETCAGEACADSCAQTALDDLENRFDENVTCSVSERCIDHRRPDETNCNPTPVVPWGGDDCYAACDTECQDPEDYYGNTGYMSSTLSNTNSQAQYNSNSNENETCTIYHKNQLAATHTFSCNDERYYIPGTGSPAPQPFTAVAYATWEGFVCPETVEDHPCC